MPRSWSLVWLAAAHGDPPERIPAVWRDRWADEAARYGVHSLPTTLTDPPNAGDPMSASQTSAERASAATAALVREVVVPRLIREAVDRGWWDPLATPRGTDRPPAPGVSAPAVIAVDASGWDRLTLAPRVIGPLDAEAGHALVAAALHDHAAVRVAVEGTTVIGAVVTRPMDDGSRHELLALGVAPDWRRRGLATRLLQARLETMRPGEDGISAVVTVAERDAVDPLPAEVRRAVAIRLLEGAGFEVAPASGTVGRVDPGAIEARRG